MLLLLLTSFFPKRGTNDRNTVVQPLLAAHPFIPPAFPDGDEEEEMTLILGVWLNLK